MAALTPENQARSAAAKAAPRGQSGRFAPRAPRVNLDKPAAPSSTSSDIPPLVDLKVANPVTYLRRFWKQIIAGEGIEIRYKVKPLTAIGIAAAVALVFTATGFGLGRISLLRRLPLIGQLLPTDPSVSAPAPAAPTSTTAGVIPSVTATPFSTPTLAPLVYSDTQLKNELVYLSSLWSDPVSNISKETDAYPGAFKNPVSGWSFSSSHAGQDFSTFTTPLPEWMGMQWKDSTAIGAAGADGGVYAYIRWYKDQVQLLIISNHLTYAHGAGTQGVCPCRVSSGVILTQFFPRSWLIQPDQNFADY